MKIYVISHWWDYEESSASSPSYLDYEESSVIKATKSLEGAFQFILKHSEGKYKECNLENADKYSVDNTKVWSIGDYIITELILGDIES